MKQLAISDLGETLTARLELPDETAGADHAWYGSYERGMAFCRVTETLATQPGSKIDKELRCLEQALATDLRAVLAERNVNLIDLGTGDGRKTCVVVEALQRAGVRTVRYLPVDRSPFISRYAILTLLGGGRRTWQRDELEQLVGPLDAPGEIGADPATKEKLVLRWSLATSDLVVGDGSLTLPRRGLEVDFLADFPRVASAARRFGGERLNVFCLLGNTLGNNPAETRDAFLAGLAEETSPGELFLLGVALRPEGISCDAETLRRLQEDYLPGEAFMRLHADHPDATYAARYEPETCRMRYSFENPDGSRQDMGYSHLFAAQEVFGDLAAAGFAILSSAIHPGERDPREPRYLTVVAAKVQESKKETR